MQNQLCISNLRWLHSANNWSINYLFISKVLLLIWTKFRTHWSFLYRVNRLIRIVFLFPLWMFSKLMQAPNYKYTTDIWQGRRCKSSRETRYSSADFHSDPDKSERSLYVQYFVFFETPGRLNFSLIY